METTLTILLFDTSCVPLDQVVSRWASHDPRVRTADSIQEAQEILDQETPELLCLQLHSPGQNALEWVEALRKDHSGMGVVVLGGPCSEGLSRERQAGADQHPATPYAASPVEAILEERLGPSESLSGRSEGAPGPALRFLPLEATRIARAKQAYATRRVPIKEATQLITGEYAPQVGDVVLARVGRLGQHKRLELTSGRRATLFQGDEIVVCYGNRYAPDQFETEIPASLAPCHLVAAGGIAAECLSRSSKVRAPTGITPIGVMADANGWPLNLADFGLASIELPPRPTVTAVIGTSMNAGKTTTASHMALGLTRDGHRVAAAKVTGTGAGCDVWRMADSGCDRVLDFSDCGVPSTYLLPAEQCEAILTNLVAHLSETRTEAIILEVADGILQTETKRLVKSAAFKRLVDQVVFAAGDALSAAAGVEWLSKQGVRVIGVSGALTAASLAIGECSGLVSQPVLTSADLAKGKLNKALLSSEGSRRAAGDVAA